MAKSLLVERIYFMIGIVYSSKTGNTQSLANSLNFMESKYCVSVEDAKKFRTCRFIMHWILV